MSVATNGNLSFNNSQINNLSFGNLEINNLSFGNLEINNLYGSTELSQRTKEYIIGKAKDISQILIEIYLESYKTYTLYNLIDSIYQTVCDKKQEKTITYEQKIKTIYDFYLDKFKKNTKISEVESKLLSSYRDKIDWIKYNIPRAKQDSLSFFYSVYALNELLNFYFDDYLGLTEFLEPSSNISKLGEELYIENEKLNVI
ncbi:TPA: hypothetical protein SB272_001399 [Campylobacter coli]|nr:hypothetical protein [Campylobacter coli]HEF9907200.1 hypothetical protein [Campylobacter coli]HEF9989889.1 hypothetical protein [Campylobacter coli]HEG0323685.1 hypothetical protein [Campylobacter coli]